MIGAIDVSRHAVNPIDFKAFHSGDPSLSEKWLQTTDGKGFVEPIA